MTNERKTPDHCPLTHGISSPLEPRVIDLEYRCNNFERQLAVIHEDHKRLRAEVEKINTNLHSLKNIAIGGVCTLVMFEVGLVDMIRSLL